jgi:cytochrome oxidase assembly protein ShyY1
MDDLASLIIIALVLAGIWQVDKYAAKLAVEEKVKQECLIDSK